MTKIVSNIDKDRYLYAPCILWVGNEITDYELLKSGKYLNLNTKKKVQAKDLILKDS